MANNRIYMRCKGCGAWLYLGKTFLQGYFIRQPETLGEELNKFYDDHNYCENPRVDLSCVPYDAEAFPLPDDCNGCDGAFDIVYENTDGTGVEDPHRYGF